MAKAKTFVAPIDGRERVRADGGVSVPGEQFQLDDEAASDPHNARLIEDGQIIEVEDQAKPKRGGGE